jgi:hypothetical protein
MPNLEKQNERNTVFAINDSDRMTSPEAAIYLRISKGTPRHFVSGRNTESVKLGRAVRLLKKIFVVLSRRASPKTLIYREVFLRIGAESNRSLGS